MIYHHFIDMFFWLELSSTGLSFGLKGNHFPLHGSLSFLKPIVKDKLIKYDDKIKYFLFTLWKTDQCNDEEFMKMWHFNDNVKGMI